MVPVSICFFYFMVYKLSRENARMMPQAKPAPERFQNGVIEVGASSIQEFLTYSPKGKFVLEFYAPWCGHCQRFSSALDELAHEFHGKGSHYVGRVDISENDALAGRFEINQIPSLYLRDDYNLYSYTSGQFTKDAVKEWILKGHKRQEPFSGLSSPLGMIGQFKGGFTQAGVLMDGTYSRPSSLSFLPFHSPFSLSLLLCRILTTSPTLLSSIFFYYNYKYRYREVPFEASGCTQNVRVRISGHVYWAWGRLVCTLRGPCNDRPPRQE